MKLFSASSDLLQESPAEAKTVSGAEVEVQQRRNVLFRLKPRHNESTEAWAGSAQGRQPEKLDFKSAAGQTSVDSPSQSAKMGRVDVGFPAI